MTVPYRREASMTPTAIKTIQEVRSEIDALYRTRGHDREFTDPEERRYRSLLARESSLLGRR
jgi:hypothetical protein